MAYQKKTWLARLGQGLNKFIFNGGSKVTLDSSPDVVTQEGTPLSAENMNDLEQRIDDAFTSIIESGTGYIRYSDGTQICYGNESVSGSLTTPAGNMYSGVFNGATYAKAFLDAPSITITTNSTVDYSFCMPYGCIVGPTYIAGITFIRPTSLASATVNYSYIAIGKWK